MPVQSTSRSTRNQSPSKPPSRAPRRSSKFKLRYVVLLLVIVWAFFEYWHDQRPQLESLQTTQRQLQHQLSALQNQQNNLKTQIKQLNSPVFIEQYATKHYNLIVPGQVPFDFGS